MLRALREHATYANVMSTLAVFMAMSGVAWAASLPRDSVGTAQLKKNAVTGPKVKKDAITGAKIKKGAVTTDDLKDQTVGFNDLAPGVVLQGPKGDTGERGAAGDPAPARAYGYAHGNNQFSKSKNVVDISNPATGKYCIQLAAGIDPVTAVVIATPDFGNGQTTGPSGSNNNADQAIIEADSRNDDCGGNAGGKLEVDTFVQQFTNGQLVNHVFVNQPFFFVVP